MSSANNLEKKRIIKISKNINKFNTRAKEAIFIFLCLVLVSFETVSKSDIKVFNLFNIFYLFAFLLTLTAKNIN